MNASLTLVQVDELLEHHDSHGLLLLDHNGRLLGEAKANPRLLRELLRLARLGALAEAGGFAMTAAVVDCARREWERLSPP